MKRPILEAHRISIETTISLPSDNSSARVDLDTGTAMARITIWQSGSCDMEVLDVNSGNTVFQKHVELSKFDELEEKAIDFFRILLGN